MSVVVRFAPSPTGLLHVGNVRSAIINWLFARKNGGEFILRLDDTDEERSTKEFAENILSDMRWLGLNWDRHFNQLSRIAEYDAATAKLKELGRLYPCYETAEELSLKRKTLLGRGLPPVYDRAALKLTDAEKADLEAEGRRPHWRFLLDGNPVIWQDMVHGELKFDSQLLGDPVLIREDGRYLYSLCSVVDDIREGVTHIIRGEDHITNTATQIQMFEALGSSSPAFAHLSLMTDADGGKLSKRLGSLTVRSLREEESLESINIIAYMARLGSSDPVEPRWNRQDIIDHFDLSRFSRAPVRFDMEELNRLNGKILHKAEFSMVKPHLDVLNLSVVDEVFWESVKHNLNRLPEIKDWWAVAKGPIKPVVAEEDKDFLLVALQHLPTSPWNTESWGQWTKELAGVTGRKGKTLFMPLRLSLTGRADGPDLASLLPLIGEERAKTRLQGLPS
ncbi:MAG: glutamate--tRNA ligase [Alphaproteobacteria bacterium]